MWHQHEKNNRKGADMGTSVLSPRRHLNGSVMTFVTLLLFATIATLVRNYEGVQRLVKLVPTDAFYGGVKHPLKVLTPKPSKENETSTSSDSLKKESAADTPLKITLLQPLVVDLTILKGSVAKGAGNTRTDSQIVCDARLVDGICRLIYHNTYRTWI